MRLDQFTDSPARRRKRVDPRRIGASPLTILAPPDARPTRVRTHVYDAAGHAVRDGFADAAPGAFRWIDVAGLADKDAIAGIARALGLSDLAIAEMFQTDQRPQTEVQGDLAQTFIRVPLASLPYASEQACLTLGPGFVLTVSESAHEVFEPVRRRMEAGAGRIRSAPGYLFYALIDAALDAWFPILESYGDAMEEIERAILQSPDHRMTGSIHRLKRDLLNIRRALWPMRDALGPLTRDAPQIEDWMLPYLRDLSDHAFQALDMVEVYREVAQGLVDLHLSSLSNRMNEIMKVLTIISTLFIPMTFIAGVYGMNFDRASPWNMPELGWRFGYPFSLALMAGSGAVMIWMFRRLGWLGGRPAPEEDGEDAPGGGP